MQISSTILWVNHRRQIMLEKPWVYCLVPRRWFSAGKREGGGVMGRMQNATGCSAPIPQRHLHHHTISEIGRIRTTKMMILMKVTVL